MVLRLTTSWLTPRRDAPLLVVGPSLGTSSAQLWHDCVSSLADVSVVAWELPGHDGAPVTDAFDVADLAQAVSAVGLAAEVELAREHGRRPSRRFAYAGDSLGGAVGLQLALDAPEHVASVVLLSTGARIGEPGAWTDRAAAARDGGTEVVVDGSIERWFARRTRAERPDLVDNLVSTLRAVDPEGYARCCEALAHFDVTRRLEQVAAPVLAVAGEEDVPTPVTSLSVIADGVLDGRLAVLPGTAHLPPAEQPRQVATLIEQHLRTTRPTRRPRRDGAGSATRTGQLPSCGMS